MPEPGLKRTTATPPLSVETCWFTGTGNVNGEGWCWRECRRGRSVRIKTWFSRWGIRRAAFGNCSDEERGLADGDGFAASLGVGGGVLDGRLDEGARGALAEWAPGEVAGELEIEVIDAVAVGLAGSGGRFEDGDVHAGGLDGDVGVVDGLAEEVVGADGAGNVVSGAVVAFWLVALFGELDGNFELGKDVTFDIQCNFGGVGRRRASPMRARRW